MAEGGDTAGVLIPPPIAWGVAFLAGLFLHWLWPLPLLPASWPHRSLGIALFIAGFLLGIWAVVTIHRAGSHVEPYKPTTTLVDHGPYGLMRNPIYLGMFLGQIGVAIGFDSLWMLAMLVPFAAVIRYGVVAREEAYLLRKFSDGYRSYCSRVRRWL